MHPAASVILFTVATGAGYGLLALLGVGVAFGLLPPGRGFAAGALGLALALVTAGLLASTVHLGHPERAWRALSQWRSSWLSREGVAAVATYVPAGLFGIGWALAGRSGGWVALAGLLAALGAVVTVSMTGMIYASLRPVPQWHSRFTVPGYLLMAAASGGSLLAALLHGFGAGSAAAGGFALLATLAAWGWKRAAWRHNAAAAPVASRSSAIGLAGGRVRSVEWPHTAPNYVLKEMAYRVGRKHAARLRQVCQATAFALPAACLALSLAAPPLAALLLSGVAAVAQLGGFLVERWLFFAEAEHVVTLYYGLDRG